MGHASKSLRRCKDCGRPSGEKKQCAPCEAFYRGMVVGAAIIAWAEAIRENFPCLQGGHFWGWSPGRNADVCQECGHVADENE